ncbi:MAG: ATP-binding protein [Lysinibacillus sp.]
MREVDTSTNFKIKLNGEWAFSPGLLLPPDSPNLQMQNSETIYSNLPEAWNTYFDKGEAAHYGTYRLKILKEHNTPQLYSITIPDSLSLYEIYVNGKFIGGLGDLATTENYATTISKPLSYNFMLDSSESEIMIRGHQANLYIDGGITKAIVLGDLKTMENARLGPIIIQVAVCVVLALYVLYTIVLSAIGIRDKSVIYFYLLSFNTFITILVSYNKVLFSFLSVNWVWAAKLFYISYTFSILFFILFIQSLIAEYAKSRIFNTLVLSCSGYLVFLVLAPIEYVYRVMFIFSTIYIVFPIIVSALILLIVLKGQKGVMFLLLAVTAVSSNSLSVTQVRGNDLQIGLYPFDILIGLMALSAFWFTGYFQTTLKTKQLSQKLQQEIDQKDIFLANTSHELRNPLHGIIGITQTLLEENGDPLKEKNQDNLKLLLTISNHMSFIIDGLLDLVHLKEKAVQLQKKPINIHSIATGVSDMFHFMLQGKPVELLVTIPKDLPHIMADENRLTQVLSNLIHNAIKFTDTGSITVDAFVQGNELFICIKDTGMGIEPSMQFKIFDPYEQVDANATSIRGGLGLGLSICQELVTLHGGTLSLSSTVGEGSTFTFSLPILEHESAAIDEDSITTSQNVNPSAQYATLFKNISTFEQELVATTQEKPLLATSKSRILVVDDDAVNLQVLSNVLSTDSYDIVTVLNGYDALAKLEEENFDLVISDIMMPHMSGYELANRIRERFTISELPILFLTARHQREDIYRGFLAGVNDYVTKPMEYIELKARVHALIHVKQSSEERLRMEAAWLQAQIQPHFFFNTLNSIISLLGVDDEKMEELLLAFSDYLQMSFAFQNADLVVPIDYELNLVRSYITIEQIRFGDRITVIWDIAESIQLSVPPLSIQTLVENAIQHGILKQVEGGTITIRIIETDDQFIVSIIDDGVGFNHSAPKARESVGFINTSQRLKQLFGVDLCVDSVLDQGTTISFAIPKK